MNEITPEFIRQIRKRFPSAIPAHEILSCIEVLQAAIAAIKECQPHAEESIYCFGQTLNEIQKFDFDLHHS